MSLDSGATRVIEAGEGPALVFLHGIASHLEAHLPVLPALADEYRVVLYDMPGRGFSERPDTPYTIDYLSAHLVELLDALDIGSAFLSGQSLGGWTGAWTAAQKPERVTRLVLNNPGNITSRPDRLAAVRESNLKMVREASLEDVRARLEWLFHQADAVTDEHVAIRHRIYGQPGYEIAMGNINAILDPEIRQRYAWSPEWCTAIEAPTTLIWSRHNPLAQLEDMERLTDWIPNSELVVLEHSAEFPQIEEPEAFLALHRPR